jgi:hypothetical protein
MSGGSHDYLFAARYPDILDRIEDMESMEHDLLKMGHKDIAKDVRRLIEYCESARNRIEVLTDNLRDVFHAVEWYCSGDIGDESLVREMEEYRRHSQC